MLEQSCRNVLLMSIQNPSLLQQSTMDVTFFCQAYGGHCGFMVSPIELSVDLAYSKQLDLGAFIWTEI